MGGKVKHINLVGKELELMGGSGVYVGDGEMPEDCVLQIIPDGRGEKSLDEVVKAEALRLARVVEAHQSLNCVTFPFLCDLHIGYKAKNTTTGRYEYQDGATVDAGNALVHLLKLCPADLVVIGGDLSAGSYESTNALTKENMEDCAVYLHGNGTLFLQGNHDDAPYMATEERLTRQELYTRFNRRNLLAGAVIDHDNPDGNYGYLDLEGQKMRVIYLNTDDKPGWETVQTDNTTGSTYLDAGNITAAQLKFLAECALDFSDKDMPEEWGIVVCSHRPLVVTQNGTHDVYNGNVTNAVSILDAFVAGNAVSITHGGETVECDFSTGVRPVIYACIYGHRHCYEHTVLGAAQIRAIGCPNVLSGRERASFNEETYTKTQGTEESTAFCVITIDRENGKIYADHYGAGYDRSWTIGDSTDDDNGVYSPSEDDEENAGGDTGGDTGSGDDNNDTGGEDNGSSGEGDVDADNLLLVDEIETGVYLSGGSVTKTDGTYDSCVSGLIEVSVDAATTDTLYCENITMKTGQDKHRLCLYDSNESYLNTVKTTDTSGWFTYSEIDGNIESITIKGSKYPTCKYIRICCEYIGAESRIYRKEV